jgi:E3 ubiquitin-protein ligase HUWE1
LVWLLENDITGVFDDETFTVSTTDDLGRQEQLVEIVEGGKDLIVTNENKHDFVDKMWRWRLETSVARQLSSLKEGFLELICESDTVDFGAVELSTILNGTQDINVEKLRRSAVYNGGYEGQSVHVQWFWNIFEGFDQVKKRSLLKFITGVSKLPHSDEVIVQLQIVKASSDNGTDSLPTAHTCFNQVVFPEYETIVKFESKLLLALLNCDADAGFFLS